MRWYKDYLINDLKYKHILYVSYDKIQKGYGPIHKYFEKKEIKNIHYMDVVDQPLEDKIQREFGAKTKYTLHNHDTRLFMLNREDIKEYDTTIRGKTYSHQNFYIWMRKKYDILMDDKGKPIGGKYSYDKLNRESVEEGEKYPRVPNVSHNDLEKGILKECREFIEANFKDHYSAEAVSDMIPMVPFTHSGAKTWFQIFLKERLEKFGKYEDAVIKSQDLMWHSFISPMLNNGLLSVRYVIEETMKYSGKHDIAIQNVEGFIRQVLGWREYTRTMYVLMGNKMRVNHYGHKRKLSDVWYSGKLGIEPIDDCIRSAFKTGYLHHIRRLMFMGNFMLLCQIDPDEIYRWFMEFSLDSYEWVMYPNVYGMALYSGDDKITTKPYISTSNYILKMSDYKKGDGEDWSKIWDALYYTFIHNNLNILKGNPRLFIMMSVYNKKTPEQIQGYLDISKRFLTKL